MSTDLETDLAAAFVARAATTITSDDAWARIQRRVDRRDHRRSVFVKSAAAAALVVLVVGAGVVLFRDDDRSATVATGSAASKSAADSSASSPEAAAGGGAAPDFVPVISMPAFGGLSSAMVDGRVVLRFTTGDGRTVDLDGASGALAWKTGAAVGIPTAIFGIVPADADRARVTYAGGATVSGGTVDDPSGSGSRLFLVATAAPGVPPEATKVDALNAEDVVVATRGAGT